MNLKEAFCRNHPSYLIFLKALFMVEEGPMPEEVDEVLRNFGFPMGSMERSDLSGNTIYKGFFISSKVR